MKKVLITLAMVATIAFTGCSASIATVGSIDSANSGKKVTAEASSTNWLQLTPMSVETAEEAAKSLAGKCSGEVVNVTSHWKTTSLSILSFETLTATGYCK